MVDDLRLILLIAGVILIAGIFAWGVLRERIERDRTAHWDRSWGDDEFDIDALGSADDAVDRLLDQRAAENARPLTVRSRGDGEDYRLRLNANGDPPPDAIPIPIPIPIPIKGAEDSALPAKESSASNRDSDPESDPVADRGLADESPPRFPEGFDIDGLDARDQPSVEAGSTPDPGAVEIGIAGGDVEGGGASVAPEVMRSLSGMRAERDDPEQLDLEGLVQVGAEEERRGGDGVAHHGGDALSPATAEKRSGVDAMIPALTVMARAGNSFDGERLRAALESQGLRHGRRSIFHHFDDAQPLGSPPRFSAANIVNPGTFDLSSMSEITTPGIALFLEIPGPVDPRDAFEQMLEVAQTLAVELDGNLCDDTRSTLTSQSVNHLREMIADFSRRQLLRV